MNTLPPDDHNLKYNENLPYADLLVDEVETSIADICRNIALCTEAEDYERGVYPSVNLLIQHLDLKHPLSRSTRAALARLLFNLVVTPGLDLALADAWAKVCIRLISKKKKLGPEDLTLPWRPLFERVEKILFLKSRERMMVSDSKHVESFLFLVDHAQRFFAPSASKEILDELLPKFSAHSVSDALKVQGYLTHFLPVVAPRHSKTFELIAADDNTVISPKDYLPTLFSLWSTLTPSSIFDSQFTDLVSRIAEENIEYLGQANSVQFTQDQIKAIFTVCLRSMSLPVGSKSDAGGSGAASTGYGKGASRWDHSSGINELHLQKRSEKSKSLARFIVYNMFPDGHPDEGVQSSYTLMQLSELIQAVELYFHPVNHGNWSFFLCLFARNLAYTFLKRWRQEQEDSCRTPAQYRLTVALRRQFVLILRPVIYLSMFGKASYVVRAAHSTLQYLAWLEPSLILPGLLERIYPSLETLEEAHRTTSALGALTLITIPLFSRDHYPAGGKHLLPLLHLATPGIDLNDDEKTITTLLFISSSFMTIPLRDLTESGFHYNSVLDTGDINMDLDDDDPEAELSREAEDEMCRLTTGEFEEWLAKFMRRVFTIFENLPQADNKKHIGDKEMRVTHMLLYTCDIVFGQLSDELYNLALQHVVSFVREQVLPNAIRAAGMLCGSITSANPKKAAKQFIPLCIDNIKTELEHGAASTVTNSASSDLIQSDSTFHWYQRILFSVASSMGAELLNYKEELLDVIQEMTAKCKSRRGIMWTGKLLRYCLRTLLDTYPKEFRSLQPDEWENDDIMSNSHLSWGKPGDPGNVNIDWHVPSEAEKDFAVELLDTFLVPSMTRLSELISDDPNVVKPSGKDVLTNEFCRHLVVVRNCVMGSSVMVSNDGIEPHAEEGDELYHSLFPEAPLVAGYTFTDPSDPKTQKAKEIRKRIGELMHSIAVYFKTKQEDDVESIKVVIKTIRTYLTERGVEKQHFDRHRVAYSEAKRIGRTPLSNKRYPRGLLVRRVYNHHLLRLRLNDQDRRRTPLHDDLLRDLVEMSLSHYAEIRIASQSALFAATKSFLGSKKVTLPLVLAALEPNEEVGKDVLRKRMKGALYLLASHRHKTFLMSCMRDWQFIPTFVMSLCRVLYEDKESIRRLARRVYGRYAKNFNAFSLRALPLDDMAKAIQALHSCDPSLVQTIQTKATVRKNQQLESFCDLLDSLVHIAQDPKTHWIIQEMAANFIVLFIRPEVAPTAQMADFASNYSLSELLDLRRIGVRATTDLLLFIKQRSIAQGDVSLLLTKSTQHPLKRYIETDEQDNGLAHRILKMQDQPITQENADKSNLVDNPFTGWYVWPKRYAAYEVCTDEAQLPALDESSRGAYEAFHKTFTSQDYWKRLMKYMSEEVDPQQGGHFSLTNVRLYSSIFGMYHVEPIAAVKEQLLTLCASTDQKHHQRAAAELLTGIVRGTKHWPLSKIESLWEWLVPLVSSTLDKVTPDSRSYWECFVRYCVMKRDPRRVWPIIDLVLRAKFDPTSDAAQAESMKLSFVRMVIRSMKWRAVNLSQPLLESYLENIQHPYKDVREMLGSSINEIMQMQWIPSFSSVTQLLAQDIANEREGVTNVSLILSKDNGQHAELVKTKLETYLAEAQTLLQKESSDYANASKTVLSWLANAFAHGGLSGTVPYVLPFLPHIFKMQEVNDDQDLQSMAKQVLYMVAQLSCPPELVTQMLDEFVSILTTCNNWHIRVRALPILQVFFFKHLFAINDGQRLRIMEMVSGMLFDTQIEVRKMAAVTLAGLVRCSQRDAIASIQERYTRLLEIKLPRCRRDKVTGKLVEPAGFREAVLQKHAGALGLSSLVNAFPYDVPKWMPDVLCQLAGCMSDPTEIQSTIQKTFSDFRRTHSDTWHEDKAKFTEDQLHTMIDMLVSPSYYA